MMRKKKTRKSRNRKKKISTTSKTKKILTPEIIPANSLPASKLLPSTSITNPWAKPLLDIVHQVTLQKQNDAAEGERRGKLAGSKGQQYWSQRLQLILQERYIALYRSHPWVRAAVDKIGRSIIGSRFEVVPSDDVIATGRTPDPAEREWISNLFQQPNPEETNSFLIYWGASRLKLTGESFFEVERNAMGVPINIYTLQGKVMLNADEYTGEVKEPKYLQFMMQSSVAVSGPAIAVPFNSDEVIQIIDPNPIGGLHGHSQMESLELSLLTDIHAATFNKNIFMNSAKRTLIFQLAKGLSHTEAERNREEIREHYQSAAEVHAPALIIEGETTIKELQESLKDVEFQKGRAATRQDILSVFGVPPATVGIETKADEIESEVTFSKREVKATVTTLEDGFNHWLYTTEGVRDWKIQLSYVEAIDERKTARLLEVLNKRGLSTINEGRKIAGLPPIDGGDVIRVYSQKTGTFIDPLNPPDPILPPGQAPQTAPAESESQSIKERIEQGEFSLEDLMEILSEEFTDEELREVAPDFFQQKDMNSLGNDYQSSLSTEIEKIEKRVLNIIDTKTQVEELDVNFRFPDIQIDVIPSGSFRVSSTSALKRGYIQGQRDFAKSLGKKVKWPLVPKTEFKRMKARANRVARKLQRDLFAGEPKSGRLGIKRALMKAQKHKWSQDKLRKELSRYFAEGKGWKAKQIARTETMRSYYLGMGRAAKKMGITKGYIQLGGKPCEVCSSAAMAIGTNHIDVIIDFFAGHHPNPDCMMVPVESHEPGMPVEKAIPKDFKKAQNLWLTNLEYAVHDEFWGSIALADKSTEVWKRIKSIEDNLHYLTRYDYLKDDDIQDLAKALKGLPGFLVSRAVFELLNFVEFHEELKDQRAGWYISDSRYFQFSRSKKEYWPLVWVELVGRMLFESLSLGGDSLRLDPVLQASFDSVTMKSFRIKYNFGDNGSTNFAENFRHFYHSPDALKERDQNLFEFFESLDKIMRS
jgi:HK97 family phage portal protein